jgi:hypothetical protein
MKIKQFSSFFRRYISTFAVGQHPNPRTNLHTLRIRKANRFMSFRLAILNIDRLRKSAIHLCHLIKRIGHSEDSEMSLTIKSQNKIYSPKHIQLNQMLQQRGFIKRIIFLFESKHIVKEKLTMAHH